MSDRLPLKTLIAYALPALPLAALTLPLYMIVPTFYAEAVGLSLASIGTVILLVRAFDAINDPVMGYLADRLGNRYGRRRTWLLWPVIPLAISAWMLLSPPMDATLVHLAIWATLLSVFYTAIILSLSAWGAELSENYHEKSSIVGFREAFVLAGTVIAISVPFTVGWGDGQSPHGLTVLAILIVITLPLFSLVTARLVPEPIHEAPQEPLGYRKGISLMVANRPFVILLSAFVINGLANALPATLFLFYVSDVLGAESLRGPLLLLYFVSAVIGIPLWTALSKRSSKHRTWCNAMILACFLFVPAAFLGKGDALWFVAICITTGICLGADLVLPASMQADVIEDDKTRAGTSRAGLFFSVWSLATKVSLALAIGIAFPLLEWSGFSGNAVGTEKPIWMLLWLYALVPVGLKLVAIAMMWRFPLNQQAIGDQERSGFA